jgi:signal transduction histidine kinase
VRAEASKLRARLAGLLTEELRNQLDAIVGVSEQMQERDQHPSAASYRPLENIQASSQRLLATIEALIDQAEHGANIFELDKLPVRVSAALQDAAAQVRGDCARLGCSVSVDADTELIVEADPKALRQMLLVLLSYPLRFVGPGGAVAVSGCRSGADTIVEVRSTGLINAVADDRDKIELQLVGALALAHGARLTTTQQDRSGRISRLTFFATQAA